MKLLISDKELYFDNVNISSSTLIGKILEEAERHEQIFSHIIVDGIEVFENIEEYIEDHLQTINYIELKFITLDELVMGIMQSTSEYVERALPELRLLSEECYQDPGASTWGKLEQLMEGIQWFEQTANFILQNQEKLIQIQIDPKFFSFTNEVKIISEAVEGKDFILLGDIVQYEIIPKFDALSDQISTIISKEVQAYDIN
ncbi:hypothetical protein E8L90_26060 [Brevibacillus antibioticus]|uniref:Uncharacterized protein n=1 Tax=Brevibacillus antibioticus TaxID=2570228 RepID=A0A4U2YDT7_9BACL|nr:hypothetical protein [Brevibacillus antibioticus]TKI58585.1 hypothetical protein E8L90_26060 [Brevibacillus antibioticus]